jgi:hypothetical protein
MKFKPLTFLKNLISKYTQHQKEMKCYLAQQATFSLVVYFTLSRKLNFLEKELEER